MKLLLLLFIIACTTAHSSVDCTFSCERNTQSGMPFFGYIVQCNATVGCNTPWVRIDSIGIPSD